MPDSPHDKLFKEALGDPVNAAAELRSLLPAGLLAHIDLATLSALPGSFVDEALVGSESDLLFSARIAGRETLLYVLFEHKSHADRWSGLQLLRYMVRIWDRYLAATTAPEFLPPIVPILFHHSDSGLRRSTRFEDLLDPVVAAVPDLAACTPRFSFLLDDISHASDSDLRRRALTAFGLLALFFLRDARTPTRLLAALANWADLFRQVASAPNGRGALTLLFGYLSMVGGHLDQDALREGVRAAAPQAEELIMTLAEQWQQEGFQKGLEQGLEQGLERGLERGLQRLRTVLTELLETKFGAVPEAAAAKIEAADEDALARLAKSVLTASSIDDVFAE